MRVLTEEQAKQLICPFRLNPESDLKCLASGCIAWQPYSPNNMVDFIKSSFKFTSDQGFCDYNGRATPVIIGTVGAGK